MQNVILEKQQTSETKKVLSVLLTLFCTAFTPTDFGINGFARDLCVLWRSIETQTRGTAGNTSSIFKKAPQI